MRTSRVVAVRSSTGRGSGYVVAPQLVLTSAHVTSAVGTRVTVFAVGDARTFSGRVVWRGTPDGRDDAALVDVDDPGWVAREGAACRWGRVITNRPGIPGQAWGFPEWAQREGRAAETWQPSGTLNPGNRYVGDRYVLSLTTHPPAAAGGSGSPWAGLSGAALFCGDLLTGVVASDPADSQHAHLEAVPVYVLARDPVFRQVAADHGVAGLVLEPVEAQQLSQAEPPVGRSPAALLRARQQVVGFRGRGRLLRQMQEWSQPPGFAAWLLYGPAGQGKTRLAQELAQWLAEQRWAWLWLRGEAATDTADTVAVLAEAAVPLLVIVDYAETRAGQVAAVLRACARHSGDTPLRVMLLARSLGDWWDSLRAADPNAEALLEGTPTVWLPELEHEPAGRAAAYRQAITDLARALASLPAYQHHDWPTIAGRLAAADPRLDRSGSALTLQMTALANLLDAAVPPPGTPAERPMVEDRLLAHERRYWQAAAAAHGLDRDLSTSVLLDALATAMLLGAATRDEADTLLGHLPALADQPRDRRDTVRDWIAQLYPSDDARPWGSLQPDRLAERFVGTRLQAAPTLVDPLLAAVTPTQIQQLLTVYARAAHHPASGGRLGAQLTQLCTRHAGILAIPAIDIATQTEEPGPLLDALRQVSTGPNVTLDTLVALADRLPDTSHRLAEWAADLTQLIVETYRGLVDDRRRSARRRWPWQPARPDAFLPDLATSLNNLSIRLGELGRREDALTAIEEAVHIRRQLAVRWPGVYQQQLDESVEVLAWVKNLPRTDPQAPQT
ncbi:MAG TPA: hypothetical protein VFM54_04945 [Micromonosporaceae bacterium]|nr:hypothetical protein [Micromonosporaceae bacterium]